MEPHELEEQRGRSEQRRTRSRFGAGLVRAGLFLLLAAAAYVAYALLNRTDGEQSHAVTSAVPSRVIQLDVFNGCGANGIGAKFTKYLREQGFDVVETKNYQSFKVRQTLVIDRVGNLAVARRVAATLGVSEDRVIQQLNPDYFVDVSVVIGSDYSALRSTN